MRISRRLLFAVLPVLGACNTSGALRPLPDGGIHVLFIGNSLTAANDLPQTVAAIAALANDTIRVMRMTANNTALVDHLNGATDAVAALAIGGWDHVVLQQGPTPAGICRDSLVLWTQWFDPLIRAAGARPAILMTWPGSRGTAGAFDIVRESFQAAAAAVQGAFIPGGAAWQEAWRLDPTLRFYGSDGFHPSPLGSFLVALVIYERLSGHDARLLPPTALRGNWPLVVSEPTVRLLQEAAHRANELFPSPPPLPIQPALPPGTLAATC